MTDLNDRIIGYVTKYMDILGVTGEAPIVKLRSNLGSAWLGRSTWSTKNPNTTLLEIQQAIIGDERTLERVIAHEMIHHRDALMLSEADIARIRLGIKPAEHGTSFHEGAERINAIMGPDFVTTTSDKEYKYAPSRKEFVVLVTPLPKGQLGYAWAARLGPKAIDVANRAVERGARLVRTTDERWTRGAKIERFGGYSVPKDGADQDLLKALFDAAGAR